MSCSVEFESRLGPQTAGISKFELINEIGGSYMYMACWFVSGSGRKWHTR